MITLPHPTNLISKISHCGNFFHLMMGTDQQGYLSTENSHFPDAHYRFDDGTICQLPSFAFEDLKEDSSVTGLSSC